jgi:hypothetical protein
MVACAIVGTLAAVVSAYTYVAGRRDVGTAQQNGAFDKRVGDIFDSKLIPVTQKLDGIGSRLDKLEGWKEGIGSKVRILQEKQDEGIKQNEDLKTRLDQQIAINHLDNPARILAVIAREIELAQSGSPKVIPQMQIVDYKRAILGIPPATRGYWQTVQNLINYESSALQARGLVPDPAKVARRCFATSGNGQRSAYNVFDGVPVSNCIVDLDTQVFKRVIFTNSVIRSRGGSFILQNVAFINCRFVLDLPERQPNPNEQHFLLAIIAAPAQQNVKATT